MFQIAQLTCDDKNEPKDVGTHAPLFSFCFDGEDAACKTVEWVVQVAMDCGFRTLVWDSGWKRNNKTIGIVYQGEPLRSCTRYVWRVLGKANGCIVRADSEFETTILHNTEWKASMIAQDTPVVSRCDHVIEMSKRFSLPTAVRKARLYITAQGLYRASINGKAVTDAVLTPGFTTYHRNLLFQTYDVTKLLQVGDNMIASLLGYGWYGRLGTWPGQTPYAEKPAALLAQLAIEHTDGTKMLVVSDSTWVWSLTHIASANLYHGEIVGDCPCTVQRNVAEIEFDFHTLAPHDGEMVRCAEVLPAQKELHTPKGELVFDFGQNLSGFVRIRAKGKKGDVIRLRHAETLDKHGDFYTGNLRSAKQMFQYTFQHDGECCVEPQFSFFGFRYLCVDEFPGRATCENFQAVALYSDMPKTLHFSCSHKNIEKLVQNTLWGMKSNFVDIPTDCPQRDERLGWTGDALAFCDTASYFMRTSRFFEKWMHDMRENQYADGAIPNTIPDMFNAYNAATSQNRACHSAAGWSEAALVCPYTQYQFFANKRILQDNFDMMQSYLEYVKRRCETNSLLWEGDEQLGDWLALDAAEGSYSGATPNDYVASAYFAQANRLMAEICAVLAKPKEQELYQTRLQIIEKSFRDQYYDASGKLLVETQTACVLALKFQLSPAPEQTAAQLMKLIRANKNHLATGFLGTPHLCQVLFDHGYADMALSLLHQDTYPSWLYPITKGATTIWEHWDGIKPDGTMWSEDMNSFNHYAYGSVCNFIFSRVVGLQCEKEWPGFEKFTVAPCFAVPWDDCSLSYRSVRGTIKIEWHRQHRTVQLLLWVPSGTSARLVLDQMPVQELTAGHYTYTIQDQWKTGMNHNVTI